METLGTVHTPLRCDGISVEGTRWGCDDLVDGDGAWGADPYKGVTGISRACCLAVARCGGKHAPRLDYP